MSIGLVEYAAPNDPVARVAPTEEVLGGGRRTPLRGGYATIANAALLAEQFGGAALWESMMMDPFVSASVRILIAGCLFDGLHAAPNLCADDERYSKAARDRSQEMATFLEDAVARMPRPLLPDLKQLLRCGLVHGTGLAEKVQAEITTGPYKGKLTWDRVKPKPIGTWAFRCDLSDNVLGITGWTVDPKTGNLFGRGMLSRDKFAVFAWDRQDGSPAGRSVLREAQPAWNMRLQVFPLWWDFLDLSANPKLWGRLGKDTQATQAFDEAGVPIPGKMIPPIQQLGDSLQALAEGSFIALSADGAVGMLQPTGEGGAFTGSLDALAREIVFGILGSARINMEAVNSSKRDGETQQDLFDLLVRMVQSEAAEMIRSDLYRPLIADNFGEEDAAEFTPIPILGGTAHQDFSRNAGAIARLFAAKVLDERDRAHCIRFLFGGRYNPPMTPPKPVDPAPVPAPGANPAAPPSPGNVRAA